MRYVRFESSRGPRWGRLHGEEILPLSSAPYLCPDPSGEPSVPLSSVRLLAPVDPGKILCVGFNYRDHARELGRPIPDVPNIFMKPLTCLTGPDSPILLPAEEGHRIDYEGELVAVIGKKAFHVSEEAAKEYLFGVTCGNDVTARDMQTPSNQWTICKGMDTFAPVGPWIETEADPDRLSICTKVNGKVCQSSNTDQLIFSVSSLIAYLSRYITLLPGDILFTGTPYGVGPVTAGNSTEVTIENIGTLRNPVQKMP